MANELKLDLSKNIDTSNSGGFLDGHTNYVGYVISQNGNVTQKVYNSARIAIKSKVRLAKIQSLHFSATLEIMIYYKRREYAYEIKGLPIALSNSYVRRNTTLPQFQITKQYNNGEESDLDSSTTTGTGSGEHTVNRNIVGSTTINTIDLTEITPGLNIDNDANTYPYIYYLYIYPLYSINPDNDLGEDNGAFNISTFTLLGYEIEEASEPGEQGDPLPEYWFSSQGDIIPANEIDSNNRFGNFKAIHDALNKLFNIKNDIKPSNWNTSYPTTNVGTQIGYTNYGNRILNVVHTLTTNTALEQNATLNNKIPADGIIQNTTQIQPLINYYNIIKDWYDKYNIISSDTDISNLLNIPWGFITTTSNDNGYTSVTLNPFIITTYNSCGSSSGATCNTQAKTISLTALTNVKLKYKIKYMVDTGGYDTGPSANVSCTIKKNNTILKQYTKNIEAVGTWNDNGTLNSTFYYTMTSNTTTTHHQKITNDNELIEFTETLNLQKDDNILIENNVAVNPGYTSQGTKGATASISFIIEQFKNIE